MKDDKGNRAGNILRYVFPVVEDNQAFLEFLENQKLSIAIRKQMLKDTYKNIKSDLKTYIKIQEKQAQAQT